MSVRKRTRTILGGAAALALAVTAAPAAEEDIYSAGYMVQGCRAALNSSPTQSRDMAERAALCGGVIAGMSNMGALVRSALLIYPRPADDSQQNFFRKLMCVDVPGEAPISQLVGVVIFYIDGRPARLHEPFMVLALEALRAAWPCK
jgi:hypothetical protein